jgi:hypothetical protein
MNPLKYEKTKLEDLNTLSNKDHQQNVHMTPLWNKAQLVITILKMILATDVEGPSCRSWQGYNRFRLWGSNANHI